MTYVYRAYSDTGRLLYVGVTDYLQHRFDGHLRAGSPWLSQLAHIDLERHRHVEMAYAAEEEAIKTEWPLYNVQHSIEGPRRPPHLQRREQPVSLEELLERERRVTQALRAAGHCYSPRLVEPRFLLEVDPFNELPETERLRRAIEARRAHYQPRAIASVEGRRRAAEARREAREARLYAKAG